MTDLRRTLPRGRLGEALLIAAAALLLVGLLLLRTDVMTEDHPTFKKRWDHHTYIQMAVNRPFDFYWAPYCWRIAVPLLAKALPFELQSNFLILSVLGVWVTGVATYYLARALGFTRALALVGMLLFFSLGWATKFVLFNFWLPDAVSFGLTVVLMWLILARKDLLFVLLLALGVTVKESVLFVAPLYYTLNARRVFDPRLLGRSLLLTLPAVLVLVALRIGIPTTTEYSYMERLRRIGGERIEDLSWKALRLYTSNTFGVLLLLLPFLDPKRNLLVLIRFLPFLLLVYSQILLATNTERLLVLGFPALIIMALNGLAVLSDRLRLSPIYLSTLPIAMLALNISTTRRWPVSDIIQLRAFLLLMGVILLAVGVFRLVSRSGFSSRSPERLS